MTEAEKKLRKQQLMREIVVDLLKPKLKGEIENGPTKHLNSEASR